jgi:hypothetical protein
MPYIKTDSKCELLSWERHPATPGELNYMLTALLVNYLGDHGTNYTTLNSIIGALECAKQEFYRRVVVPYERVKEAQNGDVYPVLKQDELR